MYSVAFYIYDEYIDADSYSSYEDALVSAYDWQSANPDTHVSRLFEIDDDDAFNYKELDL